MNEDALLNGLASMVLAYFCKDDEVVLLAESI
jgi:hypothetical protein